ncbi:NAD(P)H-binding protein [Thalassoroseus pseudoceratinae]|uniref:NAD(P)H-binding protein n=1 Tax=Thalassoroseus pseudoceratinae TaxID=2713176 RepID=UPI0014239D8F|nr:NAD(P)H-binding protein [Thalassoroseus pseudoceratinae]
MPHRILLTGSTGYIGGKLLTRLQNQGCRIRCLARSPEKLEGDLSDTTEIASGNVLDRSSLDEALADVDVAFYLVHLMGASGDFEKKDRQAAQNFASAAEAAGVRRIIYMGGLGESSDPNLSPHLRSRQEVGEILRNSGVETIEFRASVVIGNGSLSFDLVKSLTERLPIMVCPKWLATRTQPIAVNDMLDYLMAAITYPSDGSRVFEVGGRDVVTYGQLIREYAKQKGLTRVMVSVPLLTPRLSSWWLGLVTPTSAEVGRHLIEGLRNPTIVRDQSALAEFDIRPMSIQEAVEAAIADSQEQDAVSS